MKIVHNKWSGRLILFIGFAAYVLTGKYLDGISLLSHRDPFNFLPIVNIGATLDLGLAALYIAAFFSLRRAVKKNPSITTKIFTVAGLALIARSVLTLMVQLTFNVGAPIGYVAIEDHILNKLNLLFHNDFFFSGHTSAPFIFWLFFRKESQWQNCLFAVGTGLMALGTLLMRHHYAVDVIAAFPIVLGIYLFVKYCLLKKGGEKK